MEDFQGQKRDWVVVVSGTRDDNSEGCSKGNILGSRTIRGKDGTGQGGMNIGGNERHRIG